jgi:transcriptional regulator with XRE-family HTH domain
MQLNNIKMALLEQGMKQGELAAKMQIDKNTVSNWANNRSQPSLKKLYVIAEAIGCPAPRLLKEVNPLSQPENKEA